MHVCDEATVIATIVCACFGIHVCGGCFIVSAVPELHLSSPTHKYTHTYLSEYMAHFRPVFHFFLQVGVP